MKAHCLGKSVISYMDGNPNNGASEKRKRQVESGNLSIKI